MDEEIGQNSGEVAENGSPSESLREPESLLSALASEQSDSGPNDESGAENGATGEESKHGPTPGKGLDAYKREDGSYDTEKLFNELQETQKRAEGLRKKIGEGTEKYSFADFKDMGAAQEDGWLIDAFAKAGVPKGRVKDLLKHVSEMAPAEHEENSKEFLKSQLDALGDECETILKPLAVFAKTMEMDGGWTAEDRRSFDRLCTTAENVRTLKKIVSGMNVINAGKFNAHAQARVVEAKKTYSNQEQIDAFKKAYAVEDVPSRDREIARLEREFGMRK